MYEKTEQVFNGDKGNLKMYTLRLSAFANFLEKSGFQGGFLAARSHIISLKFPLCWQGGRKASLYDKPSVGATLAVALSTGWATKTATQYFGT
ncbi:MAG: hypothetical protein ABMA02_12455 [Saprospiraceae bacterium]